MLHVEIDSHAPENTYDVRSDVFAFVAEEEPPFTFPGSAALIFSPLRSVAVPCAFTQALSHRCHEGFLSHDPHREQGMLEEITCNGMSFEAGMHL